jgi:hypothetical protein
MPRVTQAPPVGVVRNATPEATPGRWWDSDHVRFRGGQIQPIGGNVALQGVDGHDLSVPFQLDDGTPPALVPDWPRDVLTWHDNGLPPAPPVRWAAFGTDAKLYVYCFDTHVLQDITPAGVGRLGKPGAPVGYGSGDYGEDTYGTSRDGADIGPSDIAAIMGDMWSLATFGEDLLVVPTQDGHLFRWSPAQALLAPTDPARLPVLVATAPTNNRGVIVTDQRHVVLLGAGGDPRNIAWSDQENPDVWGPLDTNLAGSKLLVTQSYAMTATKVSDGILIFTANDVHKMTYVGAPYAYGITQIGFGCGPLSLRAVVAIGSVVVWPGAQTFWGYSGNVQPVPCDVGDWFYSLLNRDMVGRVFGSPNPAFSEFWFDWPSDDATECSRYLIFNYGDAAKPWAIGTRNRTAADPSGTMDNPVLGGYLVDHTGSLFLHEYSWLNNRAPRAETGVIYAESGNIVAGEGDKRLHIKQIVADQPASLLPSQKPSIQPPPVIGWRFYVREQPGDDVGEFDTGLYSDVHGGLVDVRFSGRSIRMRLEALADGPFAVGRTRLEIRQGGRR